MITNPKSCARIIVLALLFSAVYSTTHEENNTDTKSSSATENTTDYLLPDSVIPIQYHIHLEPHIAAANSTFNGKVKILAVVLKTTSNIVLHNLGLQINNVSVLGDQKLPVLNTTENEKYQFLNIRMVSPIYPGTQILIEISYSGKISDDISVGFFKSTYKRNNQTRYMLGTHMAPTFARAVFPCFDEPALKAFFHMSVEVPHGYTAISNMPVKAVRKHTFVFEKTPLMSTYLIALVVSEFQSLSNNNDKHIFKAWSNPERADQLRYPASVMAKAIEYFESHFKVPYTLPKLDIVAMPDYLAVAMENWGLALFRESMMLYDPAVNSISRKRTNRNAVTHELGHQWFGNLVTPKSWDMLWVSEAFGTYFEHHAYEDALAPWKLGSQFVVNDMQPSMENDARLTTESVVRPVYSPLEIMAIFDEVVYTKGAGLVRMLEKVLGPEIFYGALHRYLMKNKFSTGTSEALYFAIEEELKSCNYKLGITAEKFLNSWILQPGFPVVDVHFNGNTATLKQKRFLLKSTENVTDDPTWVIPINWATQSHPHFSATRNIYWFSQNQTSINIRKNYDDWVIINLQQTGYYRVNYDVEMWKRIIKALKSTNYQVIHEINRASLIDDLFNLGRVGSVDYNMVFSATQYLAQETSYIPWRAAFEGLNYLKKRLTGDSENYNKFKLYVMSFLEPIYNKLGFEDIRGESHLNAQLRELVLKWVCNLDNDKCIRESLNRFERMKESSSYRVPPNQQSVVYCTAVKHGSYRNWNYLWKKFEQSDNAAEQLIILSALACSQNSTNLERLLLNTISPDSGIRKHDVDNVFEYVVDASIIGAQTAMEFIGNYYDQLQTYVSDESAAFAALDRISKYLTTEELVKKFDSFIQNNKEKMKGIYEFLQGFLTNSVYELNWYKKYSPQLQKSLTKYLSN